MIFCVAGIPTFPVPSTTLRATTESAFPVNGTLGTRGRHRILARSSCGSGAGEFALDPRVSFVKVAGIPTVPMPSTSLGATSEFAFFVDGALGTNGWHNLFCLCNFFGGRSCIRRHLVIDET